jgi:uncharacterized membrane protein HdeD (DUF308 family)
MGRPWSRDRRAGSEIVMGEPADPSGMLAYGGRHWGWEPAYGTVTLIAAIAVHAWTGETLPVAVAPRGIQLIAAGPFKFAAAFRASSIGQFSVHRISQP